MGQDHSGWDGAIQTRLGSRVGARLGFRLATAVSASKGPIPMEIGKTRLVRGRYIQTFKMFWLQKQAMGAGGVLDADSCSDSLAERRNIHFRLEAAPEPS